MRSRIGSPRRFAKRAVCYLPGMPAHCQRRLGTCLREGMNDKIEVVKRMAYGLRDDAHLFLEIRAVYPVIPC